MKAEEIMDGLEADSKKVVPLELLDLLELAGGRVELSLKEGKMARGAKDLEIGSRMGITRGAKDLEVDSRKEKHLK